jgi:hypothetical protein
MSISVPCRCPSSLYTPSVVSACGRLTGVEGWQVGLIAVVVVGLGVIVFGAVRDRRLNERRRREMLAPPERSIPRFAPDAPTPAYLSELQARRPPSEARGADLTEIERTALQEALAQPDVTTVEAGCPSDDLVTDQVTGWSVLRRPDVLVSTAPISVVRELLGILENQVPTGHPLVVVAPSIGQELISTFEVNHIQRVITILPIISPDEATSTRIAAATGATPLSHSDLQSGYNPPTLLGSCATWVATRTRSHLLTEIDAAARDVDARPENG